MDLDTNEVDRVVDMGPQFDPDSPIVTDGALWVGVESTGEVWRIPLAAPQTTCSPGWVALVSSSITA